MQIVFNFNEIGSPNLPKNIIPLDRIHNNHPDPNSRFYKYLGILIDENLSYDAHFKYLGNKLNRALFCLRRAKPLLTKKSLRILYFSFFHSHLLYCSTILGSSTQQNINKVTLAQKKAIRIINFAKYNDHTSPLFIENRILPFEKIIYLQKLLFMHAVHNNYSPPSFVNIWPKNETRNLSQNLRNSNDYALPHPNSDLFKKSPIYSFPDTWNNCGDLKFYQNRTTFKIAATNKIFCLLDTPT